MQDSFLTVAEVAELLKLNPQTIRNWIDRGELRAVRVGERRVRVRQADLDRFLESGTTRISATTSENEGADSGRQELLDAMAKVRLAVESGDAGVVDALRALATLATKSADALQQRGSKAEK